MWKKEGKRKNVKKKIKCKHTLVNKKERLDEGRGVEEKKKRH